MFNRSVLLLSSPSFQVSSFNISRVSPGTVRADLARGGGARSTVCRVKVAVGGLASLLQLVGRGVGRQRLQPLHIFSGRQELRMLQSLAASVPWVHRACSSAAWVVVDTIWMVEFSARVTLYGGQEPATPTIFLGGYSPQHAGSGGGAAGYEWGGQWQHQGTGGF